MPTLLIRNATKLVTMDGERREIEQGALFIRDGVIEDVGTALPSEADNTIDAQGCVVTPGLVNTHHHLCQTLTRPFPMARTHYYLGGFNHCIPFGLYSVRRSFSLPLRWGWQSWRFQVVQ